jgi:hypothetical protein
MPPRLFSSPPRLLTRRRRRCRWRRRQRRHFCRHLFHVYATPPLMLARCRQARCRATMPCRCRFARSADAMTPCRMRMMGALCFCCFSQAALSDALPLMLKLAC